MLNSRGFGPGTGVEKLCEELKRKSNQLDSLENTLHGKSKELGEATEANASLTKALRQKEAQLAQLLSENAKLSKEAKQRAEAASNLQQQLASAKGSRASSQSSAFSGSSDDSVAGLKEALDMKERQIALLQKQAAAQRAGAGIGAAPGGGWEATRVKSLQDEVATWKGRGEGLMSEVKSLQRQLGAAANEHSGLEAHCQALAESNHSLEEALKAARSDLAHLRSLASQNTSEHKSALQRRDSDAVRQAAEHDRQEEEVRSLKAIIQQQDQEKSRLEQMVANLQAQGAAVLGERKARDADVAALSAAADTQQTEIERLKVELREVIASKEGLAVHADALAAKLAAAVQVVSEDEAEMQRMAAAQREAAELQGSLEQKLRNVTERASAAELAAVDLKAQLVKARQEVEAKEAQIAEMVPVLEDREQRLAALQAEVDTRGAAQQQRQAEALILTMQTRAAGLQESLDAKATDLQQLSAGICSAQALAEERGRALEIATEQLKAADVTLAKAKAGAAGEAGDMRQLVDAGVADREALHAEVERLTLEVAAKVQGTDQVDALLAKQALLTAEVAEGEAALRAANDKHNALAAELAAAAVLAKERALLLENLHEAGVTKDRTLREMKEAAKDQAANIQMLEQQLNGHDASMMDIEGGRAALQMELSGLRHTVRGQEMEVADLRRELAEAQAGLAAALLRAGVAEREATPKPASTLKAKPAATTPVKEDTPEPESEEADDPVQENDELNQEAAGGEVLGMEHLRISVPLAMGLSGDAHLDSPSAAVAAVNAAATPSALRVSSHTLHLEASEVVEEGDEEEEDEAEERVPTAAEEAEEEEMEGGNDEESAEAEPVAADATEAAEIPAVLLQGSNKASLSPVVSLTAAAGSKLGEEAKMLFQ